MGLANMQFIQLSGEVRYSFSDSFVQKRTIFGRASELKKQRSPGSLGPDCKSMARSRSPRRCGGRILPVLRMQRHAYQESFKLLACENCNNYSEVARHKGMTIARSCHADFQSCQHLPTVSFGKFYSGRATVESGRLQSDALVVTPPVEPGMSLMLFLSDGFLPTSLWDQRQKIVASFLITWLQTTFVCRDTKE